MLPFDHHNVVLDGDDTRIDVELGEQRADRDGAGDVERFAVQSYRQSLLQIKDAPPLVNPGVGQAR